MDSKEISKAYELLFKSNLGQDLLSRLDGLYNAQLKLATKADKDLAWAHLNKADGIELVRAEFKRIVASGKRGTGRK